MTEKELNTVRNLKKELRDIERRLQELKMAAENIVPVLNGLPCSKDAKSRVEKIALDIVATEHIVKNFHEQIIIAKSELADRIMREVNKPILQTLLILRYVECLSFKETARRMGITLRHVFRLHEKFFKCHIVAQNHS